MSIRFADDSGGLPSGGILFAQQDQFAAGVSGVLSSTLANAVLFASGTVSQAYILNFDVQLNITPNYGSQWYQGISLTMAPTLDDAVLFALGNTSSNPTILGTMAVTLDDAVLDASGAVGLPVAGTMNITLASAVLSASGSSIAPIYGDMNITLDDAVLVAGNESIGVKTTKVHVQLQQTTKVWVR